MRIPGDKQIYGSITGRTSGLLDTLPNPKKGKENKLGTSIKAALNYFPPDSDFYYVGFDFSALELVIAAVFNDAEFCRWNNIPPQPMVTEISQMIMKGNSKDGTDIHTVMAKRIGIERSPVKTLEYASLYGSSIPGLQAVLRPLMPDKSEAAIKLICDNFQNIFKGKKIYGTKYWEGGYFSHFFNYAYHIISAQEPKLPFGSCRITRTLWPQYVGNDYMTSRMNWNCQRSGGAVHDSIGTKIDTAIFTNHLEDKTWFSNSTHDELWFVCHKSAITDLVAIIKEAHAKVWQDFFRSVGMGAPIEVQNNIEINVDYCPRKSVDTPYLATLDWSYTNLPLPDGLYK